jgi:hypothetical protein
VICRCSSERKYTLTRWNRARFFDQRRKNIRFPLNVRVVYSWVDATGSRQQGQGQTVNITTDPFRIADDPFGILGLRDELL